MIASVKIAYQIKLGLLMTTQLTNVLAAIDQLNNEDPNKDVIDEIAQPKELLYGQRMSQCLNSYWPEANEYLQIAVRAQHVKRWQLKRTEFPEGKAGYLCFAFLLGQSALPSWG